ncbi:MAG: helix-turn-helix transcriptional regulator [Pseudonocardiaceae bacterium]
MDPGPPGDDPREEHPALSALIALAALSDPFRRRLYRFIRRSRRPVNREQAAASVGISRKLAAFHLDKLVDVGLLSATHEPVGQVRKVGRTPKVYQPTQAVVRISIPEHQHDLLAEVLLNAVIDQRAGESVQQAALRLAAQHGEHLGRAERTRARPGRLGAERALTLAQDVLTRHGFEPSRDDLTTMRLSNCPFHPLTAKAPELVCAINHAFLTGFLHGLQATTVHAVLAPHPPECCVQLRTTPTSDSQPT